MPDDIHCHRPAVRHANLVPVDIEDFAVEDTFVTESFCIGHAESFDEELPVPSEIRRSGNWKLETGNYSVRDSISSSTPCKSSGSGESNSTRRPSAGCVNASRAECKKGRSRRCTARRWPAVRR